MAGDELTLCYESTDSRYHSLKASVGGAYRMHQCYCGSILCFGSMSRRALNNALTPTDMFFMCMGDDDSLKLDVKLIRTVNAVFREKKVQSPDESTVLRTVREQSDIKRPGRFLSNDLKQRILNETISSDMMYDVLL